jgi:hypothetical protein
MVPSAVATVAKRRTPTSTPTRESGCATRDRGCDADGRGEQGTAVVDDEDLARAVTGKPPCQLVDNPRQAIRLPASAHPCRAQAAVLALRVQGR